MAAVAAKAAMAMIFFTGWVLKMGWVCYLAVSGRIGVLRRQSQNAPPRRRHLLPASQFDFF